MSDRLRRSVLLGDIQDPDALFAKLPPAMAEQCRRAFIQGRNEMLGVQARLGISPPGSPSPEMTPFEGRAYYDDGLPTEEYYNHWRAYYNQGVVKEAQDQARAILRGHDD